MSAFYNQIVKDIYGCALNPNGWVSVLDSIRDQFGVGNVSLQMLQLDGDYLNTQWTLRDSISLGQKEIHDKLVNNPQNPRLNLNLLNKFRNYAGLIRDEEVFSPGCREFAALRQRLSLLGLGKSISFRGNPSRQRRLTFVLHKRLDDHLDFSPSEEKLLLDLAPHFEQSIAISEQTQNLVRQADVMESMLNQVSIGTVLVGAAGKVVWCNHYAAKLLDRSLQLSIRNGMLCRRSGTPSNECHDLLAGIASGNIPVEGVAFSADEETLNPLQILARSTGQETVGLPGDFEATTVLYISERNSPVCVNELDMKSLFGLSPAESRLGKALCDGLSLNEYSEAHGVAVGTARVQLKNIFAKTHTRRQSELVRLLCTSIAAKTLPHT